MSFSSGSGQSSTSSTQPYIISGPTVQAAQAAAQSQISAAQEAAGAVEQSTQSAISALMGQYATSLTYANPTINTGNQAEAQLNYMLGLPAVNPGSAPVAPTAASELSRVTPQDVNSYIAQNYSFGNVNAQGNNYVGTNFYVDPLTGYVNTNSPVQGAQPTPTNPGATSQTGVGTNTENTGNNVETAQAFLQSQAQGGGGVQNTTIYKDTAQYLAQQAAAQDQPAYLQQLAQYNQQEGVYNKYNAQGQATSADISAIVSNLPGFQFQQQQGINAIQNAASASGQLNSGNLLEGLNSFGQGLSQQYYNQYLSQLSNEANMGAQATSAAISGSQNLGTQLAGQYVNQGTGIANSLLAQGQANAESQLLPAANQTVNMFPYTTTSQTQSSSSSMGASAGGVLGGISSLFSSKKLKTRLARANTKEILKNVRNMQLDKWKYKGIDGDHIGPYAEEFKEMFGVGDGQTINIIDLFGVLIGSVKQLSQELEDLKKVLNMTDVNFGILQPLSQMDPGKAAQPQAQAAPQPQLPQLSDNGPAYQNSALEQQRLGMEKQKLPGELQAQQLANQGAGLDNQMKQSTLDMQQYAIKLRQDNQQAYKDGESKGGPQAGFDAVQEKMAQNGDVDGALKLAQTREDLEQKVRSNNVAGITQTGAAMFGVMSQAKPATPPYKDPQTGQIVPGQPGVTPLQAYAQQYDTIKRMDPKAPSPSSFRDTQQFEDTYVHPVLATALPYQQKVAADQKAMTDDALYKAQLVVKQRQRDLQTALQTKGADSQDTRDAAMALQQAQANVSGVNNGKSMLSRALFTASGDSQDDLINQAKASVSGKPAASSSKLTPTTMPITKTIGGKTFINQNGQWYPQ